MIKKGRTVQEDGIVMRREVGVKNRRERGPPARTVQRLTATCKRGQLRSHRFKVDGSSIPNGDILKGAVIQRMQ